MSTAQLNTTADQRLFETQMLEQEISVGPPLEINSSQNVRLQRGSADVFLRTDKSQYFVAQLSAGQVLCPALTQAGRFVLVPTQTLVMQAVDLADEQALANWHSVVLSALPEAAERLGDVDQFATAQEFNEQLYHWLAEQHEQRLTRDLNRLQDESATGRSSLHDMLVAAARALRISATNKTMNGSEVEFDNVPEVAHQYGLRARALRLDPDWPINEQGPLLLFDKQSRQTICAIWNGNHHQHHSGEPISESEFESLSRNAFALFAPLGPDVTGIWALVKFVLSGNAAEFKYIAITASFIALLGILVPLATGWILTDIAPAGDLGLLAGIGIALCLTAGVSYFLTTVKSVAIARVQGRTDFKLNTALYDRLLALPTGFYKSFTAGDLNQRLANINAIKNLVLGTALSAGLSFVLSAFYFGVLLYYDLSMALVAILLVSVYIVMVLVARVLQKPYLRRAYALDGELAELSYEMISAVAKLRTAAAEERALSRWRELYIEERELEQKIGRISGISNAFSNGWQIVTLLILFAMAAWLLRSNLPTGFFVAYLAAFGAFQGAFLTLSLQAIEIYAAQPQIERAMPIITASSEQLGNLPKAPELSGDIEMRNVTFSYQQGQAPIINDLSMKIDAGQHCAIVGASGSGKSTLLRLLLGFETPQGGAIYFDQLDLSQLDSASVRSQIGVVLQSSSLYAGSIIDNIRGASDAELEQCLAAARKAGLDDDLKQLPMGIHTPLTEGGAALSGGQRQRILIARAFVTQPAMLFFDEATSALDNATQSVVANALNELPVTRITIAHRLSTVRHADLICVLQDGRFVEQGSYEELMAKNGAFSRLAKRQLIQQPEED